MAEYTVHYDNGQAQFEKFKTRAEAESRRDYLRSELRIAIILEDFDE